MPEILAGYFAFTILVPLALGGLVVAYLSLRIRDARAELPDPELGIKSAYHAFLTAGILLALTGLSISVIDFLGDAFEGPQANAPQQPQFNPRFPQPQPMPRARGDDPFGSLSQRVAWPLVIAGVLFSLVSLLLIKLGTNDQRYPSVRRTFGGVRLVVAGFTVMAAGTLIIELLFQKDMPSTRPYAFGVGLLAIWFPASAVQVFLLKRDIGLPYYVPPKPKKKTKWEDDEHEEPDDEPRPRPSRRRPDPAAEPERHPDEDPRPPDRRRPKPRRDDDD
jgi:hypothetical protein